MSEFKLTVSVIFCIFKRLNTAQKVFEKLRAAKPPRLYLVSDGARDYVAGEKEKVEAVRDFVEKSIDWDCEVIRDYAPVNMGCGRRISSGISRVFEAEEEAIILEDDCVPDDTFFRYCQEMLEYYRDDNRILMIGGTNPIAQMYSTEHDYLFSHVPFMWGWATWRRAWRLYDYNIASWSSNRKNPLIRQAIPVRKAYWFYSAEFDSVYMGRRNDIWDYQFMYIGIINGMLGILPAKSLVQNVGFIEEATHTEEVPDWMNREVSSMDFPIKYRQDVACDSAFDRQYMALVSKHGAVAKLKSILGLDINTPLMDLIKRKR